jgi:hypothetical protein
MPLQIASSNQLGSFIRITNSDSTYEMSGTWMPNNALTAGWLVGTNNSGNLTLGYGSGAGEDSALTGAKDNGVGITVVTTSGNVGIKCTSPGSNQLVIGSGSGCSSPTSSISAGSSTFTTTSSRTFKENIAPVSAPTILEKIEKVPVVTYDFKNNGPKNRMGLIAEDFFTVFHRGDDKHIDGQDVEMALWLAVQQLTAQNKQLTDRIDTLEKQLSQQQVSTQQ